MGVNYLTSTLYVMQDSFSGNSFCYYWFTPVLFNLKMNVHVLLKIYFKHLLQNPSRKSTWQNVTRFITLFTKEDGKAFLKTKLMFRAWELIRSWWPTVPARLRNHKINRVQISLSLEKNYANMSSTIFQIQKCSNEDICYLNYSVRDLVVRN